jgi:hypothetical protein
MKRVQRIIRKLLPAALLACFSSAVAYSQSFDKLWKQVEQAKQNHQPQTAVKLTNQIFSKGEQEKNTPQMLKAYIWRASAQQSITPDSFYVDLRGLEQWAGREQQPVNRAVLHTLLANMYADYADDNRRALQQRATLDVTVDEIPADIREWSANLFVQKVREQVDAALAHPDALMAASTRNYVPLTILGESSNYYGHDMYHLLVRYAVQALQRVDALDTPDHAAKAQISEIYRQAIARYRQLPGKEDAALLLTLDSLDKNDKQYPAVLDSLIAEYGQREVCAEVYLAKARYCSDRKKFREALETLNEGIARYPKYRRTNLLCDARDRILAPSLDVRIADNVYPGDSVDLRVSHRNLKGFTLNFLREKGGTYTIA